MSESKPALGAKAFYPASAGLLALLCGAAAVQAGSGVWTALPVEGGAVTQLVASPSNGSILYAALSSAGVFRSGDGGRTWDRRSTGLPGLPQAVTPFQPAALAVDSKVSETVYVGSSSGLHKSVDGGLHWTQLSGLRDLRAGGVGAIAVDPEIPENLVVAAASIYLSRDGGATWSAPRSELPPGRYQALAADPRDARILYAAYERAGAVGGNALRSDDGGESWRGLASAPAGIRSLSVDSKSSAVYAWRASGEVFRSRDFGASWRRLASPPNLGTVYFVQSSERRLIVGAQAGLYRSRDDGGTWVRAPGLPPLAVRAVLSTRDGERLRAALADVAELSGGLFESLDGGASWRQRIQGLRGLDVRALAADAGDSAALFAATSQGLMQSRDGGEHFLLAPDIAYSRSALRVVSAPREPGVAYAIARSGVERPLTLLFRTEDGGERWKVLRRATVAEWLSEVTLDPEIPGRVLLTSGNRLLISEDRGASWHAARGVGLALKPVFDPATPREVYAVATPEQPSFCPAFCPPPNTLFLHSSDRGESWTFSNLSLTLNGLFFSVATDGAARVFVAGLERVYRSVDRGRSWQPGGALTVDSTLAVLPSGLYAFSLRSGVVRSTDSGETWSAPLVAGLPTPSVLSLSEKPGHPGRLYAGLAGGGLYSLDLIVP